MYGYSCINIHKSYFNLVIWLVLVYKSVDRALGKQRASGEALRASVRLNFALGLDIKVNRAVSREHHAGQQ